MKGIILAGGHGTRLYPITKAVSKQLLPVFDKPMIYYPLSILLLAKIEEILIISTRSDLSNFKKLLGDGSSFGVKFEYALQEYPGGLAEALIIGRPFIKSDSVCLVLGDNILYGQGLTSILEKMKKRVEDENTAIIFGVEVNNPSSYGIVELNKKDEVISIEEKPNNPKSNNAVIGLYFYPNIAIEMVKNIEKSERGEKEITSLNQEFLKQNKLSYLRLGRGFIWYDTGTPESLKDASDFVQSVQERQGNKIACLEEIAFKQGLISKRKLSNLIDEVVDNEYSNYIKKIILNSKWIQI